MKRKWLAVLSIVLLLFGIGHPAVSEDLIVHFLDVGQADAAILKCGDEVMMIDGGNREDSNINHTGVLFY